MYELESLDIDIDPPEGIAEVRLRELSQQRVVIGCNAEYALQLDDGGRESLPREVVIPVFFERRGRTLEQTGGRFGSKLGDVAARAEHQNADSPERPPRAARQQIFVHASRCTKTRVKLSIEIVVVPIA